MRAIGSVTAIAVAMVVAGCDGRPLLYQLAPSESDLQILGAFQMIDSVKAGQLTRQQSDDYFRRRFAEFDTNHDGFLNDDEAKAAVPIFGFKTGTGLVFSLDINGDGRLSQDEFLRLSNYLFTRDLNRDGILTLQEVKTPPTDTFVAAGAAGTPGIQVTNPSQGGQP